MKYLILTIATLASISFAVPAVAQDRINVSKVVSYQDLNLSTETGMKVLTRRIRKAAETVCGGRASTPNLREQLNFSQCVDKARNEAATAMAAKMGTSLASR